MRGLLRMLAVVLRDVYAIVRPVFPFLVGIPILLLVVFASIFSFDLARETDIDFWWHLETGLMVVTWDRVARYRCELVDTKRDAFQLVIRAVPPMGCSGTAAGGGVARP